jgi:riboflavin kinase
MTRRLSRRLFLALLFMLGSAFPVAVSREASRLGPTHGWHRFMCRVHETFAVFSLCGAFVPQLHRPQFAGRVASTSIDSISGKRTRLVSFSSSTPSFDPNNLVQRQQEISQAIASTAKEQDHLTHQAQVFDQMAEAFSSGETLSSDLIPVYQYLADHVIATAASSKSAPSLGGKNEMSLRVLDVGTGSGALYPFLMEAATKYAGAQGETIRLEIVGIDLSTKMVQYAQRYAAELLREDRYQRHSIVVSQSDVLQLTSFNNTPFDAIVCNACFGNFLDPQQVLDHLGKLVFTNTSTVDDRSNGYLFITHPLGNDFVARLHASDPRTVPHTLPTTAEQIQNLLLLSRWKLVSPLVELVELDHERRPIYLLTLQTRRDVMLDRVIQLRGQVDMGYGRGGKKLGFPTANLPASLFQEALHDVDTGVYFGYAVIEANKRNDTDSTLGRNIIHKAVVNVGYSPTFAGQENKEKIVESHLIFSDSIPDFYGETMKLQLHGFLRSEMKFPNFGALIQQIRADVVDAQYVLDHDPISILLRHDPFLTSEPFGDVPLWKFTGIQGLLHELQS